MIDADYIVISAVLLITLLGIIMILKWIYDKINFNHFRR